MIVPAQTRLLAIVLFISTVSDNSCAHRDQLLSLSIRVDADTIRLKRFPEGAALEARALVHNNESRPVYLVGCWPSAERDINGAWTQVFSPVCIDAVTRTLAPGDSTLIPIALYGFTATNMLPRLDPRAEPGRYRLVFWVTTAAPDPSTNLTSPGSTRRIESAPFIVTN